MDNFIFLGRTVIATDIPFQTGKMEYRRNHRKSRINKKWHKKYGMRPVTDNSRVIVDNYNNIIFVSAKRYKTIIKEIGEK
jgi:hypothetical protein